MKIKDGKVPKGYRPVYRLGESLVCFPIGIHWLVKQWVTLKLWWTRGLRIRLNQSYREGFEQGQKESGYDSLGAYQQGFSEGRKSK